MTAVEWLKSKIIEDIRLNDLISGYYSKEQYKLFLLDKIQQALEMEEEQNINQITDFQLFMYENDFISNHLWDFERMAIKFLNSKKQDK